MSDLEHMLGTAREAVHPSWTKERAAAVRAGVDRKKAKAQRRRSAAGVLLVTCLVALAVLFVRTRGTPSVTSPAVAAGSHELLKLDDGSSVVAESADARITPVEVRPEAVTVRLASGAASFSVTPNPERAFRVVARNVTVTVVGTAFAVSLEPSGVRVRVTRGRVRVDWPGGQTFLGAAEEIRLPEVSEEPRRLERFAEEATAPVPSAPTETAAASSAPPGPPRRSWRALAQDGEYADAFARMRSQGPSSVQDDPGDLLLAADVARLGGHPEEAVPRLERVVSAHAGDSRAPLAAFTLGRTLLDQLGRPREAAQAFETARRLDSSGALAQDALAREVESWSRAGESGLARERAEEYLRRYPNGRRAGAVRRLGGLE